MEKSLHVGIFVFENVELLDFCGPYEVFSAAENELFKVSLVAAKDAPVKTVNGMKVLPDFTLENAPPFDIFILPGGVGVRALLPNSDVLSLLQTHIKQTRLHVLTVCTGALFLAKLGHLSGLPVTTHRQGMALLKELDPSVNIVENIKYVDNGFYALSAGISAGIELSLYMIAKLKGLEVANQVAFYMEYDWQGP